MKKLLIFFPLVLALSCGQSNSRSFSAGLFSGSQNSSSLPNLNNRVDPEAFAQSSLITLASEVSQLNEITLPASWPEFNFLELQTVLDCFKSTRACSAGNYRRPLKGVVRAVYHFSDLTFNLEGSVNLSEVRWRTRQDQDVKLIRVAAGFYHLGIDEGVFYWSPRVQKFCHGEDCVNYSFHE